MQTLSALLNPNILLSTLISDTLRKSSSINVRDKVSNQQRTKYSIPRI